VFEELEQEKNKLSQESAALSKKAEELTALANNMNDLSTKGNALVDEYNQDVLAYNKLFGYAREFTQGDYEGDRINIYKFSNDRELVAVLTHEFGHSLGLDHVEGETSVMYYLLTETGDVPVLSLADKAAFLTTCGSGDELSNRVRSLIRTVLTNTNFL
jgi:predicted NACHT family NTPase